MEDTTKECFQEIYRNLILIESNITQPRTGEMRDEIFDQLCELEKQIEMEKNLET